MYVSSQFHSSAQTFQDWNKTSEVENETLKYTEIKRTFYDFEKEELYSGFYSLIQSH